MNREGYSRTKSSVDDWETPQYFFDLLNDSFTFTLDPCASDSNHLCDKYFTEEIDGLDQDWKGNSVFVNPPFKQIARWMEKCYEEGQKENTIVVAIIPPRTDTKYWHDYVMKAKEIWFCVGRVNFLKNGKKPKNTSNFPLVVVVFDNTTSEFPIIKSLEHKGGKEIDA